MIKDMPLIPTVIIITTITGGTVILIYCTIMTILEYQAQLLLEELNAQYMADMYKTTILLWEYSMNITDENMEKKSVADAESAKHDKEASEKVNRYPWRRFSNYSLKRQLEYYAFLGYAALPEEKYSRLMNIIDNMEGMYSTAKICPMDSKTNCSLYLDPDLTDILAQSTDPEELKYVWVEWRNAIGPRCRKLYKEYINLSNEAAKLNDFEDMSAMLLGEYEDEDFKSKVDHLWHQVKVLYDHLHAYIRTKLREKYGNIVSDRGPIPAHLLGNMWCQSWVNVANFTLPYPDVEDDFDMTVRLKNHGYTVMQMFKTAEDFYKSINLTAMPDSFWSKSVFEKLPDVEMVCQATSWDFYHETDFRISQCTEITGSHFVTVHHEMGHIEYFLQYVNLPVRFRDAANDGFHEAIGDLITLSVQSTKHLKKIGLIDNDVNTKAKLNNLFRLSLHQIAFLPMSYLTDLWRWGLYTGETRFENCNCKWWELKEKYQGVEPPVDRSEKDFDPAAKYHIVGDTPYLRYFLSMIIQYQLHKALCAIAGEYEVNNPVKPLFECDIYGSEKAGTLLKKMLAMGTSRSWHDALEVVTGQREMDASGIVEYFKPLHDWLKIENARSGAFIGWESSKKVCKPNPG